MTAYKVFTAIVFLSAISVAQDIREDRVPTLLGVPDPISSDIRAARNRLFNLDGLPPLSSENPSAPPRLTHQEKPSLPELPVKQSDVILVADLTTITSRVLPNEVGIYTEYHAVVTSVIDNQTRWTAPELDILHLGGAVQLPGGRVLRHRLTGQGKPLEIGRRYLMFLKYFEHANCFQLVKIWEIHDGIAVANSNDDMARVSRGTSSVNGVPLKALVTTIRSLSR